MTGQGGKKTHEQSLVHVRIFAATYCATAPVVLLLPQYTHSSILVRELAAASCRTAFALVFDIAGLTSC